MAYTAPPTFVASDPLAAAELNVLSDDIEYLYGVSQGVTFSGAKVSRAASTNISDSTWTNVTFTAETFDYGAWWSSGTDVIVPAGAVPPGYTTIAVLVLARAKFAANGTGNRAFRISVNGTPEVAPTVPGISGDTVVWSTVEPIIVEAGDVITMSMYQTSGGTLAASDMTMAVLRYAPVA